MAVMWALCLPLLLGSHALQNAPKSAIPVVENVSEVQSLLTLQTERYPPHHRREDYDIYDTPTSTFDEEQDVPVYGHRHSRRRRVADDYAESYGRPQSHYRSESVEPAYDAELAAVNHRQHTKQMEREMEIDSLKIELGRQKLKTKRAIKKAHIFERESAEARKNEKDSIRHSVRLERALKHEKGKEAKLRAALKAESRALEREKKEERQMEARLKEDEKKIDALLKDISENKQVPSKAADPQSVKKAAPTKDPLLDGDDEDDGDIAVLTGSKKNKQDSDVLQSVSSSQEQEQSSDKASLATTSESSTTPISPIAPIDNSWYSSSPSRSAMYTTLYIVLAIAGASCILGAFASCCCIRIQKKKLLR